MTWTGQQTVDWFINHGVHYYGPSTGTLKNEYNGQSYANPFTVDVGRATTTSAGELYCADSVVDALMHAGIDIRQDCPMYCNCNSLFAYMLAAPATGLKGFKTVSIRDAQPGDVALLHFGGNWGHATMIRAASSGDYFHTMEGDTSNAKWPGSDSVGGVTTPRDRLISQWSTATNYVHVFRPTGYATSAAGSTQVAATPEPTPVKNGDSGTRVVHLQQGLNKVLTLTTDGQFGNATEAAVKHYQGLKGLTADGVVGPVTITALTKDGVTL